MSEVHCPHVTFVEDSRCGPELRSFLRNSIQDGSIMSHTSCVLYASGEHTVSKIEIPGLDVPFVMKTYKVSTKITL